MFLPGIIALTPTSVYALNTTSIVITLSGTSLAVGQSVTVSAVLVGATATASGTVTYNLYPNGVCMTPIVPGQTDTETVVSDVVPPTSTPLTPNAGGTFSVNAHYSGDGSNSPSTSLCKQLIVSKTATTITTTITTPACPPTCSIALAGTITDTATLTGANQPTAGGTAVYSLYTTTTCTGPTAQTSTVAVTSGSVAASAFSPINTPGTYTLRIAYMGDSKNMGSASACEGPVTVGKATVTITTTIVPASPIKAGTPVQDTAALAGETSSAGGTVTYTLYSVSGCAAISGQTSVVTVTSGLVPNSINFVINNIGSYSFRAVYSGDSNNAGATSACEGLTVTKSSPTISTTILPPTTITADQSVTDTAVFSTPVTSNAGGTVTYTIYKNAGCSVLPPTSVSTTVTVANGNIPSATMTIITGSNTIGTYYVYAAYTGDANNGPASSTCEGPITVNKASPTLSTQLSASQIFTDGGITDTATLTGASSNAGGSVAYKLYSGNACSGPAVDSDTEPVTNGVVTTSKSFTNHGVGTFSFQAFYSGDAKNILAPSLCNEVFTVVKHSPSISTQLSATVIPPSGTVTDTATLTGASANAGGTVTFTMYTGSLCSGTSVGSATETVTNGVVPTTGAFGAPSTGIFSFLAAYTGDGNNNPTSACNELLTVQKFSPTLSTQLSASSIVVFVSVTDTATLTGATSTAGGTVTFTMYKGSSCSGSSVGSDTETVTDGFVPTTGSFSANSVGFFSFHAVYSGDSNNNGATSSCELLTANPASPTLSILLSSNMILHGGSVTVSSGLTGATTTAGGTVKITMYTGGTCSGTVEGTATETVTNAIVPTSGPFVAPTAGTFSFQAVYSGNANNMAATSSCVILTAT